MEESTNNPDIQKFPAKKWLVWFIAALFPMYQFMLQGSPSVMLTNLSQDLSVTIVNASMVTTFFFFSYIIMQIPSGFLVDIYGPRILLILGSFLAGVACIIFSSCKYLWVAEASRLLMGFVCSPAIVSVFFLVSQWFKPKKFALVVGLTETLAMGGAAASTVFLSAGVERFGWRTAIFSCGVIGIGIALLITLFVRNKPGDKNWVAHHAKHFSFREELGNLRVVIGNFRVWIAGLYMGLIFSLIPAFFALWGIPFFMSNYHLSATQAATINAVGLMGAGIGGPMLGWLSDAIAKRKVIMVLSSLGTAILFWIQIRYHLSLRTSFFLNFFLGFICSGYIVTFALIKELLPKKVRGKAIGFANMLCLAIGAPVIQPVVALLVKNSSSTVNIYRHSLTPLLIAFLVAFLLTFFVPETHCKNMVED